jgi:3-phenylpropionate/trans-cinnamate dioxygenase ferredoxin reductase subunit
MSDRTIDVLLIGGGIASASAAAELREGGFEGSITLATREMDPPYHRPPITKGYLQGSEDKASTLIFDEAWYAEHDVELLTRTSVMALDTEARTAKLGKEEVSFGQALIATGAMVRRLQVDGAQRDGIHYLRALGNADALRKDAEQAERIVVVGGSYIATEVAASLTLLGKQCTIVCQEELPLERHFGPVAAQYARDLLTGHGIEIVASADVVEFAGEDADDAPITAVVCEDGRRIDAELVVVGAGVTPDVMLAKKIGLEIGESGGVACDKRLQTSVEGIFAAGDMCEYDSVIHGRRLRIEHEELAAARAARPRGRCSAPRSRSRRSRTSGQTSPTGRRSSTSVPRRAGTRSSCAATRRRGSSRSGTSTAGCSSRRSPPAGPTISTSRAPCSSLASTSGRCAVRSRIRRAISGSSSASATAAGRGSEATRRLRLAVRGDDRLQPRRARR